MVAAVLAAVSAGAAAAAAAGPAVAAAAAAAVAALSGTLCCSAAASASWLVCPMGSCGSDAVAAAAVVEPASWPCAASGADTGVLSWPCGLLLGFVRIWGSSGNSDVVCESAVCE